MDSITKKCTKCRENKPVIDFVRSRNRPLGYAEVCKICHNKRCKEYSATHTEQRRETHKRNKEKHKIRYSEWDKDYRQTPRGIYKQLSKRQGRSPVLISRDDFVQWCSTEPRECFYCGIPEIELVNNPLFTTNPIVKRLTIDRLNNDLPYQQGNIVWACYRCNQIKSNFFTPDEMKDIADRHIKKKWRKR